MNTRGAVEIEETSGPEVQLPDVDRESTAPMGDSSVPMGDSSVQAGRIPSRAAAQPFSCGNARTNHNDSLWLLASSALASGAGGNEIDREEENVHAPGVEFGMLFRAAFSPFQASGRYW